MCTMKKSVINFIYVITLLKLKISCEECGVGPEKCLNDTIYRSYDGSCNNLEHPKWGSAGSEYGRLRPAKYSDRKLILLNK